MKNLIAALHGAGLAEQPPADLELGVDAEAGDEGLAGGHEGEPHPPDEVAPDVDRGLAGEEHEVALVGQLRQAIDARGQHGDGLGVVLGRQLDTRDLEQLRIPPRRDVEAARDVEGDDDAGAVLLGRRRARARPVRDAKLLGLVARRRPVEHRGAGRLRLLQGHPHAAPSRPQATSPHRRPSRPCRPRNRPCRGGRPRTASPPRSRCDLQQAVLDHVGQAELPQGQLERRPQRDLLQVDGHGRAGGHLRLLQPDGVDIDRDALGVGRAPGARPDVPEHVLQRGLVREGHVDPLLQLGEDSLRTLVLRLDRAGVRVVGDGHLQREELGGAASSEGWEVESVTRTSGQASPDCWVTAARYSSRTGASSAVPRRRYCGVQVAEPTR